jgi:hypothetical protein
LEDGRMTAASGKPAKEELDELLKAGPVTDIFWAECSYELYKRIGENATVLHDKKYDLLFWPIQVALGDQNTLHVVRLFDPVKNYRLLSLHAVLELLETRRADLKIVDRPYLANRLSGYGVVDADLNKLSDADATKYVVEAIRRWMPPSKLTDASAAGMSKEYDALKTRRDKVVAHPEDTRGTTLPAATWAGGVTLVAFAKNIVAAIGRGYLNSIYEADDGRYFLSSDAERPGVALKRLLTEAHLIG